MTRIDPQNALLQNRLHSRLKSSPPPRRAEGAKPASDTVDIQSRARVSETEKKPRKSFARNLLEKTLMGGMALTTIAGALSGIGVATNYEVLKEAANQETPVTLFKSQKSTDGSTPGGSARRVVDVTPEGEIDLSKAAVEMGPGGVTSRIESQTAQGLINRYRDSDLVQTRMGAQLRQVEIQINTALESVKVPSGETLLNA